MSYWPETHLAVHPICIACSRSIKVDEMVFALLGDRNSTSCIGFTKPFPFPQRGLAPSTLEEYQPCRYPSCSRCAKSPEAFTVHVDCFKLFMDFCTSINRLRFLFTVAAWKNPWPKTTPIDWNTTKTEIYSTALACTAKNYEIPELKELPPEILYMVAQHSADALLWRYVSVLELAERLSAIQAEDLVELPLSRLGFWERGSRPLLKLRQSSPGILRLGIDLRGIKTLERFSEHPRTTGAAGSCFAFIVEEDENLCGVTAQFKDGFLRLSIPVTLSGLRLWDTPCPPPLNPCRFFSEQPGSSQRIRTIDLDEITGLTFFCSPTSSSLFAIHAHTSKLPSALSTFQRLPDRRQKYVYWIFVPLTPQDRMIAIGSRTTCQLLSDILMKTSVGRVDSLSPWQSGLGKAICLGEGPPTTLLYDEPDCGKPISAIGVYCAKSESNKHMTEEFLDPAPRDWQLVGKDIFYHSSASLNNVKCASVFLATEDGPCTGILFEYSNGSKQAVGQCAPYVWLERRFNIPLWFYYRSVQGTFGVGVLASFAAAPLRDEDCIGFFRARMVGTVTFWTGSNSAVLVVDNDSKAELQNT